MKKLAVGLVESRYGINVGYVARLLKNFGIKRLLLIHPRFSMENARRFASHGVDILESAERTSLRKLRREFDLIVGTSSITATSGSNVTRNAVSLEKAVDAILEVDGKVCLLLGRDTTGLRNRELSYCDFLATIDIKSDYQSLNISHALAIMLYQIGNREGGLRRKVASVRDRERTIEYFLDIARQSGFPKHKTLLLRDALRQILGRSPPSPREVHLTMGLARRALLALAGWKRTE